MIFRKHTNNPMPILQYQNKSGVTVLEEVMDPWERATTLGLRQGDYGYNWVVWACEQDRLDSM